jgi:polar amino acid transport system substrate-binding protein
VFISTSALVSSGAAQADKPKLTVAIIVVPPFVMQQNGSLTGFSVDLWNAVASRMNMRTTFQTLTDTPSLFDALRSRKADVIGAPVVITEVRDEEFDFSLPMYMLRSASGG